MDLKVNSLKSETSCTDLVSHDGYSLRINAFFAWLRRSGYTLEYIAERLATTPDDIVLRLRRREKFNERELRILIYLMGAKDAFFVIYFPSFRFRKYVYWCNGDKEQMLRIFATSGLFRPNKSPDYYEGTAIKALRSMPVKSTYTPTIPKNNGGNGKR